MATAIEKINEPDYSRLSPLELLRNNIEAKRFERIPIAKINSEAAIVEASHADDLGDSMSQKRGQITPIAVRAREEEGEIVYDIIDGFHRTEGKRRRGETEIDATVVYGCPDDELYDLRILAASSVRSVQFARTADWIRKSWDTTPWAKQGISVVQAFGITMNNSKRTNLANLDEQDLDRLKSWVNGKCRRWQKSLATTYQDLQIIEVADPKLVKEVRASGGARESHAGKITPERLKAVVRTFPNQYEVQTEVLNVATESRLSAVETEKLANRVVGLVGDDKRPELIRNVAIAVAEEIATERNKKPEKVIYRPPLEGDLASEVPLEELEPSDEELRALEEEKEIDKDIIFEEGRKSYRPMGDRDPTDFASGNLHEVDSLRERIRDLEQALEAASNSTNGVSQEWWKTATYLTPHERACMNSLFSLGIAPDDLAKKINIMPLRIVQFIQSAFAKHRLKTKAP